MFKALMNHEGRIWRIWANARPFELKRTWENLDIIDDACGLLREQDIDYIFDTIIEPKLILQKISSIQIDETREAIKFRGNVPFRFIIKILYIINSYLGRVTPVKGYKPLINDEPTGTDEIVDSLWPKSLYSLEALCIAYYLPKPSWKILQKILYSMNGSLGEGALNELRSSLALVTDSDDNTRATIYDPVSEIINAGNFLTPSIKRKYLGSD